MKYLLAATTLAAVLTAMPASAQTVYGGPVLVGVDEGPDVYWKQNFVIYSGIDAVAPPAGAGAATGGAPFDVWATSPQVGALDSGFAVPTDAVNPVPEPATWAMMLVGFAAVGGALRSRRTASLRYA